MITPFNFGRTVRQSAFTNRETETKRLTSNFINQVNTIIISPRRWGKSSLVEKAANQVRSKSVKVIIIDLFGIRTEEEFYQSLANEIIRATSSKVEEWMLLGKKFLKNITPKFTVELGEKQSFDLSLDLDIIKKHYRELLDLPEKIAEEKKLKIVICIDEFQNIATFSNAMAVQKRLRSRWQLHQNVTYCLYGSKQHMMIDLFSLQSNPFYRFGELMHLGKIAEAKWIPFITKQFHATGKKITPEQASEIALKVKCHPYYVQQLSHQVWINTETSVNKEILENSIQNVMEQNAILYFKETEDLNNTELRLLRAITSGATQFSSKETIQRFHLGTSASVIKAKKTLLAKEILDENQKQLHFLDPVYELWFIQQMS